ncbi:MAG TPA: hypothetical protein VFC00_14710 [Micromonosporaceae bacterium]|nr:hypothetical protein [Micromonosporaceae bacterium]
MIWPVPYERLIIDTPLSDSDVRERLTHLIGGGRLHGSVGPDQFSISPVLNYRNSFRPQIYGRIAPGLYGARVRLTSTMHPVVTAFVVAGLLFGGGLTALVVIPSVWRSGSLSGLFVPIAILAFLLVVPAIGYRYEARKVEALLATVLPRNAVDGDRGDAR